MAILRANDIRKLAPKELEDKKLELQKELIKLKTQRGTGTAMQSPGKIKAIKRTIARIHTIARSGASAIPRKSNVRDITKMKGGS